MIDLLLQAQDTVAIVNQPDSVISVQQHVGGFRDLLRLYIIPGLGTLFLGTCALLLTGLRTWAHNFFDRMKQDAEMKRLQDAKFQEILTETNARVLIAAANAQVAAEQAAQMREAIHDGEVHQAREIAEVKTIVTQVQHQTNEAAERAQRQIDALSRQLLDRGQRPEKGNGE